MGIAQVGGFIIRETPASPAARSLGIPGVAGMHAAFLVAAVVALAGAVIALLARRGTGGHGPVPAGLQNAPGPGGARRRP